MGLFVLTALFPLFATFPTDVGGPILYALHRGEAERAFENYLNYVKENHTHDYALLQQAAKALLEQGIDSKNPEIQLLCIFGAGVAASSDLIPILERGIKSEDLRTQLIALSYLGRLEDDEADRVLLEALSSPFLITRLESLLLLAKKNHPAVLGHLYSLAVKVPDPARAVFAHIAVHLDGAEASRYLHKLLTDADVNVRVESIFAVANANRDDFLPCLHTLVNGAPFAQQEAIAFALGELKDQSAIGHLKELAEGEKQESVKLAAAIALYKLGESRYLGRIEECAKNGSLFAIAALGELKEGREILFRLLSHEERDVRLNALLSLLELRDQRSLDFLEEILIGDSRDTGFWPLTSPGGGLRAWKSIPSSSQQSKNYPGLKELTLSLREEVLTRCIEFEEQDFLKIAQLIFEKRGHALIPLLVELLENKKSEGVIQFLKEGHQKAGAPLIRNYCTLSLYRLKVEGPYEEQLINWVKARGSEELIQFREEAKSSTFSGAPHQLTPEETSRFLVEACQTLASAQNLAGIDALLHAIAYGNPKNRYALAGLLLRTIE
jgi:HEAT repeat protein